MTIRERAIKDGRIVTPNNTNKSYEQCLLEAMIRWHEARRAG